MNRRFFRVAWEAADDSGAAPVDDAPVDDASVATEAPETPAAPPSFTPEDDAAHFGQRFQERFAAHHDPVTARVEYAKSVEHLQSAYGRLSQGGAPTAEDHAAAEALGVELPVYEEPAEEVAQPLWGAPWAEPTDYESFVQLANTRPDKAMTWIDKQPDGVVDADTRQQVLNYWAEHDQAGAISYERAQARQQAIEEAKAYTDQQLAEYREQITPLQAANQAAEENTMKAQLATLGTLAVQHVPDYAEHQEGVNQIMTQYAQRDGMSFFRNLLALPVDDQVKYISGLTGWVAWQNRPAAEAKAQAEAEAADAKKIAQGSARPSGGGASTGTGQSKAKQEHLASFQRLKDVEIPVR